MKVFMILALLGIVACGSAGYAQDDKGQTVPLKHRLLTDMAEAKALGLEPSYQSADMGGSEPPGAKPVFGSEKEVVGELEMGSWWGEDDETTTLAVAFESSGTTEDTYDILYVDLDRDGKIGDGERFEGNPATYPDMEGRIDFGMISIPIDLPQHNAAHVRIYGPLSGDLTEAADIDFYCMSWCMLEGEISVGDKKVPIRLIDSDLDGDITEYGEDDISIGGSLVNTLGKLRLLDGRLMEFDIAQDYSSMTVSPYTDEMGTLRIKAAFESGKILSMEGTIDTEDEELYTYKIDNGGCLPVPTGEYLVYLDVAIEAGDNQWNTYLCANSVEFSAGKETILEVGAPLSVEVVLNQSTKPGGELAIQRTVRGKAEEVYHSFASQPTHPTADTISPDEVSAQIVISNPAGEKVIDDEMESG